MVRKWGTVVGVVGVAWLAGVGLSQTSIQAAQSTSIGPAGQDARSTIWDGIYTEQQAKRGEQSYAKSCAKCHAEDLLGSTNAPALVGQQFFARFDRQTADDLLEVIRRTMPQEAPDTLGMPVYVDIVSYLLRSNGAPDGKTELPPERAKLREILVTSK